MGAPSRKTTTLKVAMQDPVSRGKAKADWVAHQQAAAGDNDVLSRCKKLNEFLASVGGDVMIQSFDS